VEKALVGWLMWGQPPPAVRRAKPGKDFGWQSALVRCLHSRLLLGGRNPMRPCRKPDLKTGS
jgi:hypothetical protein